MRILQERVHHYERALYSVFCGNLRSLLSVCENWEDFLWAHCRCLVDVRVERELQKLHPNSCESLPAAYWQNK